jgi:light-harvesting complex I chlorophyll a/b binding protein 1
MQPIASSHRSLAIAAEKSAAIPFLPKPANLDGLTGNVGFDPVGFSDYLPIDWVVEAELKHARVAMLATAGWVFTDLGFHFPGSAFEYSSVAAHTPAVEAGFMTAMFIFLFPLEGVSALALIHSIDRKSGRRAGDYSFDPLGLYGADEKKRENMRLKELTNGRLAMLAFSGIATQAVLTGHSFPYL